MTNWEIYHTLLDIRTLFELNGDKASASLYEQSAYTVAVSEYTLEDSLENAYFMPPKIKEDITEILETGECTTKDSLDKITPKSLRAIARIPGLRPNYARKIYETVPADSISDVKRALDSGKIANIFGERFEEELRRGLFEYQKENRTFNLFDAYSYAKSIIMNFRNSFKIDVAGSVRRGKETVENIDFVVLGTFEQIYRTLSDFLQLKNYERHGENIIYAKDKYGNTLHFYPSNSDLYYSKLQYYTGSKTHNKAIRDIAIAKGFKISKEGYVILCASSEEDFYSRLGMQYIPPEIREGEEEIELSKNFSLPKLVEKSDILGDLHIHSDFSDGTSSISQLKDEASFMGYSYLAITDHSSSLRIANGLTKERLLREINIIDKMNGERTDPYILKGTESEINEDGTIDTTSEERNKLDLVIGALHSFSQKGSENSDRIVKAMRTNLVNTIAHPTGRLLNVRESMNIDFNRIAEEAVSTHTALEVNLFPNRMDLSTGLIKQALRKGVKNFTVGSDAHNAGHLNFMEYGLKILRRAWLVPENILNTYQLEELKETLWTKKH